jgi:hypothetical protein
MRKPIPIDFAVRAIWIAHLATLLLWGIFALLLLTGETGWPWTTGVLLLSYPVTAIIGIYKSANLLREFPPPTQTILIVITAPFFVMCLAFLVGIGMAGW